MENITTDVLVVGAGAAGIRAALAASEAGAKVLIADRSKLTCSGSTFSPISRGWGIQALAGKERTTENLEAFYRDIIRVGLGQCDPVLARVLAEESGSCLEDLISYGMRFKETPLGDYIRVKGCFSRYKRSYITEDLKNIKECFRKMFQRSRAGIIRGYAAGLITSDNTCWGAEVIGEHGEAVRINAGATVLANGGGAGIFANHLVSDEFIGDGYALAYRAGAELHNLEFIQFMLGLKKNKARQFLPMEDLRRHEMLFDPEGRDILQRDIPDSKLCNKAVKERQGHWPFSCRDSSFLVDIAVAHSNRNGRRVFCKKDNGSRKHPEVIHFAHAFNGGIKINEKAETTLRGLFAAGEVAAGPHGSDRIGGCMMTATQVFGRRAGQSAAERAAHMRGLSFPNSTKPEGKGFARLGKGKTGSLVLCNIAHKVREAMNKYCMVLRSEEGLKKCEAILNGCEAELNDLILKGNANAQKHVQARNMVLTGKLITRSTLMRKESRGSHYREDFSGTGEEKN